MKRAGFTSIIRLAIVAAGLIHPAARADDLDTGFRSPPHGAGIGKLFTRLKVMITS